MNIAKFLRTPFYGTPEVAAAAVLKKSVHSQENMASGGLIHLPF